ncbi:ferritin-like domain-containing protein [Sorangium sp. So ce1036]|uniref:hypothetical protein n=1 Tax=Sorangium sp. So ce1036 TaxID=3133328 RepID=UPI003F03736B
MRTILLRILVASQCGASLALASGCGPQIDSGSSSGEPTTSLDPYPDPTCVGPDHNDGLYYGQCCFEVYCAAPVDGACPEASEAAPHLSDLPPGGSGICRCEEPQGPYANRAASDPASCCYLVGSIGCEGRPLLIGGEPRLAPLERAPSAWSQSAWRRFERALAGADLSALPPAQRRALAARWAERGRNEHASVASFGRFALGLMAQGAPPQLLEAAHRAAADEVRHARLALAIASTCAGEPVGVGPLPLHGALDGVDSLEALTLATVVEGCVGETLSAIEAQVEAQAAELPALRMALQSIARDEARHAELAWAFVRWALAAGGPALRDRVAETFARSLEPACALPPAGSGGDLPSSAHGFLPRSELQRLRQQAVADVIRPAAAALLASRPSPTEGERSGTSGRGLLGAGADHLST